MSIIFAIFASISHYGNRYCKYKSRACLSQQVEHREGKRTVHTNIRNTATTTVPNMVRGLVPVMIFTFDLFKKDFSVIISAVIVGAIVFGLAFYSSFTISETHDKDLEFIE